MVVGITGHQVLPERAMSHIHEAVASELAARLPGLRGVSCLAAGADQLFADELLAVGGELIAVIPCLGYEGTFGGSKRLHYDELVAVAVETIRLGFTEPTEEAFMAGGVEVVRRCDELIAVWDGQPARGLGGTADVVALARELGKPVTVVWPEGVRR